MILHTGCTVKKSKQQSNIIYKTKYITLPCKKEVKKVVKKQNRKSISKNLKKSTSLKNDTIGTQKKYRQPSKTRIYAPEKYTTRVNQTMNFMIGINTDKSKFVYMEGEFDKDTYKEFIKFSKTIDKDINEVKINSNGGVVASAMKIGSYIKENKWNTGLDAEMNCYSACGFVYFAGKEKSLQGEAKIGLHRPYYPNKKDTYKSIQKVKKVYVSYWRYIKAPMDLYYEMMDIDRDELFILDKNNIEEYIDIKLVS